MPESFQGKTDEQLVRAAAFQYGTGVSQRDAAPAQVEMLRRLRAAIQENTDTLRTSSAATTRLNRVLVWLTVAIFVMTAVMTVATVLMAMRA